MTIVAPSLLSANFLNLEEEMKAFNASRAEWLHFDVMDGHFVPNMSFGPDILRFVSKVSDKFMDVHIMVSNPLDFVDYFKGTGVHSMTFHYEACPDLEGCREVIAKLRENGLKVGISVKPKTPVEVLEPLLGEVDMVLVMSVEPGFGGQKFMPDMLEKCDWLAKYRKQHDLNYLIEIDGGINAETGKRAIAHHVDVLVAGSYVFKHKDGFDAAVDSLLGEENA